MDTLFKTADAIPENLPELVMALADAVPRLAATPLESMGDEASPGPPHSQ
jgi:hypothetical protein